MSQDPFVIPNQPGASFRAAVNTSLQALASTNSGDTPPATPYPKQMWIDTNTPSTTVWTLSVYDGTDWIAMGTIDSVNNIFIPKGIAPVTNSLSSNVSLNNTSNYFDGPSVAQGTAGTWFASGTVTVEDTGSAATFIAKLWDGTTVIADTIIEVAAGKRTPITLSGAITSPAGNIRISVNDSSATTGLIIANQTGLTKDSTLTAIRIG